MTITTNPSILARCKSRISKLAASPVQKAEASVVRPFVSFMDSQGDAQFRIVSSLHTSRLSAYGFTSEAQYLGITQYQLNEQLDGRTCPVCASLHGKVFEVSDARSLLDVVTRTQDPDELKLLQPWPKQTKAGIEELQGLSTAELVSRGWHVPPFHPRCRGLLSRVGKVGPLSVAPTYNDATYESTPEDFIQMGINLSPTKVQQWNSLIQTSPADLIAQLTGSVSETVLSTLLTTQTPQKAIGLSNLSVTSKGVSIELQTPAFGSAGLVTQAYSFLVGGDLFVGLVDFKGADSVLFPKVLKAIFGVAKQTSMKAVKLIASDLGGWAWAKYGFAPGLSVWNSIKRQIKDFVKNNPTVLKLASPAELKAYTAIMASSDPYDIFALADLPNLGEALLKNTTWVASLKLDHVESVARFASYMK